MNLRHTMALFALLASLACTVAPSLASETEGPDRTFTPVGVASGLNAQVVASMLVDREGFLWVGSREGLFRYDGYTSTAFRPDPALPGAISDTDIRVVYESADGTIWVGTNTGGLNELPPGKDAFRVYRADPQDPSTLPDDAVYGLSDGPDGGLWVATQRGVARLDRATGEFEIFRHQPGRNTGLRHDWGFALHLGHDNSFWVGTVGGGVHLWQPEERTFRHFDLAELTGGGPDRNDVFTLHLDARGRLWAGTRDGVIKLDTASGAAQYIDMFLVGSDTVLATAMTVDHLGRMWFGTMVHGVIMVDPETDQWLRANKLPLASNTQLPAQPQMSMAASRDLLFVGTWGSGVFRAPLDSPAFQLRKSTSTFNDLRNDNITTIMATDTPGQPWLGSFGGGPQRLDFEQGRVLWTDAPTSPVVVAGVLDMAVDSQGQTFAATTDGLFHIDDRGVGERVDLDTQGRTLLGEGYVSALLPDDSGDLWVGVMGTGLHLRDSETGRYRSWRHEPESPTSLSGDFITVLAAGTGTDIWIGTRSNGLNHCEVETMSCRRYTGRSGKADDISHHHVTDLYRDRRGRLWVGTDGGGLNRVETGDDGQVIGFQRWRVAQGLLSDGVMAIAEDVDESLWLSTRHGLSRINPATGKVTSYVSESGLPVSHFNAHAAAVDEHFIYFGSVDGALGFPRGTLLEERTPAPVLITQVQRAPRGEVPVRMDTKAERLVVPWGDIITAQFTTLDYSESAHRYSYRLGAEDPWTDLGTQRQVIFHGLAPGEYRLQARGRDVYGLWGQSSPLLLVIQPPFWMTLWFRALLASMLLLLAWGFHWLRLARQRRSAREIQRLSEKRESALEQALGSEAELSVLTPRQKEVLQLIAEGYTTREIADLLDLSVKTVEAHRANLMERLEIHDVPGLVRLAIRSRLVSPHE